MKLWVFHCRRKRPSFFCKKNSYGRIVLFSYFHTKMVCGNKVRQNYFRRAFLWTGSLHTLPHTYLKTSPRWQKTQHSDSIPVRRQNKLWRKIMQDSSSRARNLKHPAMCTASSRAPGGERWMPISLLFCHAVPPVSRQSCHRYSLYMETDTFRRGTWVNTTCTCVIDAETLCLVAAANHMNMAEVCTVQTPTLSWEVWLKGCFTGDRQLLHVLQRQQQQWRSIPVNPMMSWSLHLSRWLLTSHVGVNVRISYCKIQAWWLPQNPS